MGVLLYVPQVVYANTGIEALPLRKTKIGNLDVAHMVKQKVLWLQITKNYPAPMLSKHHYTPYTSNRSGDIRTMMTNQQRLSCKLQSVSYPASVQVLKLKRCRVCTNHVADRLHDLARVES